MAEKAIPAGYEDADEELQQCERWFQDSKTFMDTYHERWRKNEKLFHNDVKVKVGTADIRFNLVLSDIYSQLPIIEEYLPTVTVVPKDANDVEYADTMQLRITELIEKAEFHNVVMDVIQNSLLFSNGLAYIEPVFRKKRVENRGLGVGDLELETEAENEGGFGQVYVGFRITPVSPYTWYPSKFGVGMDIRTEAEYQIFATPVYVKRVKRDYPEAEQIEELEGEGYLDEFQSFNIVGRDKEGSTAGSEKADMVLLKECYYMPSDEGERKKFPNGKVLVWANGVRLAEEAMGPEDEEVEYSCMPYKMMGNYRTAHGLVGIGEPELVATIVGAINQVMSSLADNINKSGNPARKVLASWWNSALRKILGKPNEEIIVNSPAEVTWEIPPPVPAYVFNYIQLLIQLHDVVTGVHDVMQGRKPAGVEAGIAIAELQEAVQKRVRYKIKEYERFIRSCGEYILHLEKTHGVPTTVARADGMGNYDFVQYNPEQLRGSRMEIKVQAGPGIPGGKVAKEARYLEYFKTGLIGARTFIMNMAEPNKKELLDDYAERQGIEKMVQRQEQLNKVFGEFETLVDRAMKAYARAMETGEENTWEGSTDEMKAADIMKAYPEFLDTDEWRAMPEMAKARVLQVFMTEPEAGAVPAQTDSAGVPVEEQ